MIAVDLGCGLGGWARGFVDLGFIVHGYDIIDLPWSRMIFMEN